MQTLAKTLTLERIERDLFRGGSPPHPSNHIFGGQVIAQSLLAAYATVEARVCHSLHCYFLRRGDANKPIVFEVDRARDGTSFATRRVVAIQDGRQIFNVAASFMAPEAGFEHQAPMPAASELQSLRDDAVVIAERAAQSNDPELLEWADQPHRRVLQFRSVPPRDPGLKPAKGEPRQQLWIRGAEPIGPNLPMQQAVLAFASDMSLLGTAMLPHGLTWKTPGFHTASLDHCIWFHRPTDFGQWHLYDMDSPSACGGRGLNRGSIYSADGLLVASVAQEGLMRLHQADG